MNHCIYQRAGTAGNRRCSHSRHHLRAGTLKAEAIMGSRGLLKVPVINERPAVARESVLVTDK